MAVRKNKPYFWEMAGFILHFIEKQTLEPNAILLLGDSICFYHVYMNSRSVLHNICCTIHRELGMFWKPIRCSSEVHTHSLINSANTPSPVYFLLGTWGSGGLARVGLMVGPHDPEGLSQPKSLYDSLIPNPMWYKIGQIIMKHWGKNAFKVTSHCSCVG